ncbi:Hypothetical protein ORPV_395 [Orpheovirus IHUMI-LCC2]|uniref:Uncharacterized protein n=1 Tax=Orpheovirus IHUMI-LCC2 TaxID=2023057 RepID=A0A2I2L4A8_9VIRU|nr:Hypothetical protein ORPV_395 [Orpheovirus IHUMI-LCC2]SNW62299.1 Hypothetical protein ORPV_395 [Orpheovirus IHUMI-LCC2]
MEDNIIFNTSMANIMIAEIKDENDVNKICASLKSIYSTIISSTNRDRVIEAYNAYKYISINPLLRHRIPKLTANMLMVAKTREMLMDEIRNIHIKMNSMERDKRQPLELFELRKKYKLLSDELKNI